MLEEVISFGPMKALIGIISKPENSFKFKTGIIFLNAGLVHRIGLNRIYTKIARNLAEQDFLCLRFDKSGIGDSMIYEDNLGYTERALNEASMAMEYLSKQYGVDEFIFIGICSGANESIEIALKDERVKGILPINYDSPMILRHLIRTDILNIGKIVRSISFKVNYRAIFSNLYHLFINNEKENRANEYHYDDLNTASNKINLLIERKMYIFFLCAHKDRSLDYVYQILKKVKNRKARRQYIYCKVIPNSGHDLYSIESQKMMIKWISDWINTITHKEITDGSYPYFNKTYKEFGLLGG